MVAEEFFDRPDEFQILRGIAAQLDFIILKFNRPFFSALGQPEKNRRCTERDVRPAFARETGGSRP